MSALANMIAKQKAAQETKSHVATSGGAVDGSGSSDRSDSDGDSGVVATPAAPTARLKFGVKGGAAQVSEGNPATVGSAEPTSSSVSQEVTPSTIVSLDDLGESEETGVVRGTTSSGMAFDDEIPATAPERELPAELTESQLAFVQQLDSIYEIVHDPELFGSMIRTIMTELQECPDYMSLMADQDVHTMIRGLRSAMGLAKVKKAEKSTKARGAKRAPATSAMVTTAEELFNSEDW